MNAFTIACSCSGPLLCFINPRRLNPMPLRPTFAFCYWRQLIFTDTVMQIGLACDSTTNGSNCHCRTASRMALLNAGNGGLSRACRMVQMWLTLPCVSSRISPIHIPLLRVPGGSSGYVGLTSRTFFGGRCHSRSIRGFDPTKVAPSRSHALEAARAGRLASSSTTRWASASGPATVGSAPVRHRPTVAAAKSLESLRLNKVSAF